MLDSKFKGNQNSVKHQRKYAKKTNTPNDIKTTKKNKLVFTSSYKPVLWIRIQIRSDPKLKAGSRKKNILDPDPGRSGSKMNDNLIRSEIKIITDLQHRL
jgi:hypothetical protein